MSRLNWATGLSALLGFGVAGCGGQVVSSDEAQYDVVGSMDPIVTLSNDKTEHDPDRQPGSDSPTSGPTDESCDCGDSNLYILLAGNGSEPDRRYDLPPNEPARSELWSCGAMNEPGLVWGPCEEELSLFACHETEGCLSLRFNQRTGETTLIQTDADGLSVRALEAFLSPDYLELEVENGIARGDFEMSDNNGKLYLGSFAVCSPSQPQRCQ